MFNYLKELKGPSTVFSTTNFYKRSVVAKLIHNLSGFGDEKFNLSPGIEYNQGCVSGSNLRGKPEQINLTYSLISVKQTFLLIIYTHEIVHELSICG